MRQRRWLELLKDYDTNIQYHPGKANVVADALSRKSGMIAGIKVEEEIIRDLERLDIELYVRGQHGYWASLRIEPDLISWNKEAQKEDSEIWAIVENLDKQVEFRLDDDYVLWQDTRLVVPNDVSLREALLTEAHSSPFSVYPGSTKMYHDLKQDFWWSGMKRDVATFVSKCLICQQVKIEQQRASSLLQQLDIPVWKWNEISMDFVTGLPQTQRRHDAIWVVVDRLTKSAHFLPIRKDYSVSRKIHVNDAYNLKFSSMIGFEYGSANFLPNLSFNIMSREFYNSIMKDKFDYKGKNVVKTFMNVLVFVGNFCVVTNFAVIENMDIYRDKEMGDVIIEEPFCKVSYVKARRFDGLMMIHNGNYIITYKMVQSNPRFKHLTDIQCKKIPPLLTVSEQHKMNGISYSYQKLKGLYKGILDLGPKFYSRRDDCGMAYMWVHKRA
nr:retrotransposon protein, putative, Ty3-gypsy subclass [Tanacetum cinerariifolium]